MAFDASPAGSQSELAWAPQKGPQTSFVTCPFDDAVYGGARGGGKTDASLGDWAIHAERYRIDAKGLFVRRTQIALEKSIERAKVIFRGLGQWQESKRRFLWHNGATVYFRYLDRDTDADSYQGHDYTRVYVEELTQFADPSPVDKLRATLRSAAGVPTGFRATCNPGGAGHTWVKARYIDAGPWQRVLRRFVCPFTGREIVKSQIFIPAKLDDNPKLLENDPGYVANLYQSGSEQLVRAWLAGDWDIIEGAYFSEWSQAKHVVAPFEVPQHWTRIRGFDWGSASPFSAQWWAVASEATVRPEGVIPAGALVHYREWYGVARDKNGIAVPNVGLKMTNADIARGIRALEPKGEKFALSVADPSITAVKGGPSIAEDMAKEGVYWIEADNKRVARDGPVSGWAQVRGRLVGQDGRPMLYVFSTCRDFIRTFPALQHDPLNPEDVHKKGEDHCFTGDTLIRTSRGHMRISDLVGSGGKVWSHDGRLHRFRNARLIKRNARIVRVRFSDGSEVTCTPDHRFLTTLGWMEAQFLSSSSLTLFRSSGASAIIAAVDTFNAVAFASTAKFGALITAAFRRAATFITETIIAPITRSATCNVSLSSIIYPTTGSSAPTRRGRAWSATDTRPPSGTEATPGSLGIESITSSIAPGRCIATAQLSALTADGMRKPAQRTENSAPMPASRPGGERPDMTTLAAPARSAAPNFVSIDTASSRTVRAHAAGLRVVSVTEAGRADVFCLTVPETGNFVLVNGAIVHNCGDCARYVCMSRPWTAPAPEQPKPRDYQSQRRRAAGDNEWKTT